MVVACFAGRVLVCGGLCGFVYLLLCGLWICCCVGLLGSVVGCLVTGLVCVCFAVVFIDCVDCLLIWV